MERQTEHINVNKKEKEVHHPRNSLEYMGLNESQLNNDFMDHMK